MRFGWFAAFTIACVVPALAQEPVESVFVLKNGRKIQGHLVDENPSVYVVQLRAGGRVKLAKGEVERVVAASPSVRPVLAPRETEPRAPDPSLPAEPAPVASPAVAEAPSVATLLRDGYRGAPSSIVSDCITWLDEQAARAKRSDPLSRWDARTLVSVLVALPEGFPARALALEAALARPAAFKLEALHAVIGTRCRTAGLIDVLAPTFDATTETALAEALPLLDPLDRQRLIPLLEGRVTFRSAPALARVIAKWQPPGSDPTAFGRILAEAASRDPLPARLVQPLIALLDSDPDALPPDMRIEAALLPLRAAPRASLGFLERLVRRLASDVRAAGDQEPPTTLLVQLQLCYETLAAMNDPSALDVVKAAVADEEDSTRRRRWIRCLGRHQPGGQDPAFLRFLVEAWEKHEDDGAVVSEVLTALTGRSFSNSRGQWREYVDGLR